MWPASCLSGYMWVPKPNSRKRLSSALSSGAGRYWTTQGLRWSWPRWPCVTDWIKVQCVYHSANSFHLWPHLDICLSGCWHVILSCDTQNVSTWSRISAELSDPLERVSAHSSVISDYVTELWMSTSSKCVTSLLHWVTSTGEHEHSMVLIRFFCTAPLSYTIHHHIFGFSDYKAETWEPSCTWRTWMWGSLETFSTYLCLQHATENIRVPSKVGRPCATAWHLLLDHVFRCGTSGSAPRQRDMVAIETMLTLTGCLKQICPALCAQTAWTRDSFFTAAHQYAAFMYLSEPFRVFCARLSSNGGSHVNACLLVLVWMLICLFARSKVPFLLLSSLWKRLAPLLRVMNTSLSLSSSRCCLCELLWILVLST